MILLLRAVRRKQNISAKEIAHRLGVSPWLVWMIESERLQPTASFRRRFTEKFGKEAEVLLNPVDVPNFRFDEQNLKEGSLV